MLAGHRRSLTFTSFLPRFLAVLFLFRRSIKTSYFPNTGIQNFPLANLISRGTLANGFGAFPRHFFFSFLFFFFTFVKIVL